MASPSSLNDLNRCIAATSACVAQIESTRKEHNRCDEELKNCFAIRRQAEDALAREQAVLAQKKQEFANRQIQPSPKPDSSPDDSFSVSMAVGSFAVGALISSFFRK